MTPIDEALAANRRHSPAAAAASESPLPRKMLAVVACMDCRLDLLGLLGLEVGDAHLIRNAGGTVTEDALRSLLVSQQLLGTEHVMLVHHEGCGMSGLRDEEVALDVEGRTGSRPPFPLGGFPDVQEDVRAGLRRVREAAYLPSRDSVRGFVVEMATGRLQEVLIEG